jgi:hypothetical protein
VHKNILQARGIFKDVNKIKEVLNINGVWFLYNGDNTNLVINIKVGIKE